MFRLEFVQISLVVLHDIDIVTLQFISCSLTVLSDLFSLGPFPVYVTYRVGGWVKSFVRFEPTLDSTLHH
jgi:hypothetical protein